MNKMQTRLGLIGLILLALAVWPGVSTDQAEGRGEPQVAGDAPPQWSQSFGEAVSIDGWPWRDDSSDNSLSFSEPAEKIYEGEKISRDFQKLDIREAIQSIAGVSGKNIVISDGVKGRITLKIKDVPWDLALNAVLSSQNLVLEESGNVLMIYDQAAFQRVQAGRIREIRHE